VGQALLYFLRFWDFLLFRHFYDLSGLLQLINLIISHGTSTEEHFGAPRHGLLLRLHHPEHNRLHAQGVARVTTHIP